MANTVQLKRSSVVGKVPDAGNVAVGEPVVNLADKKVFTKDGSGSIVQIAAGNLQALADVSNAAPSTNQVLTWNGTNWSPNTVATSSWTVKTSNYTASAGNKIIADTSSGTFTITLPATPSVGDSVVIADGNTWATANVAVARNGSTIEGYSETLYLDIPGITVELVYDGSTWEVYSSTGAAEIPVQTSYAGSYLKTNGATLLWDNPVPNTGVVATTYGNATNIPVITVNAQGRITSASNVIAVGGVSSVGGSTGAVSNAQLYASFEASVPPGTSGNVITSDGTDWVSRVPVIVSVGGATGAVSNAQLYASFEASVPPGTNGNVLVSNGSDWVSQAPAASGTTITSELSSNLSYYPVFTTTSSGSMTAANVSTTKFYFVPSSGTLSATSYATLSDRTLKDSIVDIAKGIDVLENIRPVSFIWKDSNKIAYGVIAQEIENILPGIVETAENGLKSVSYTQIIPFLVQAIKELKEEIRMLKGSK